MDAHGGRRSEPASAALAEGNVIARLMGDDGVRRRFNRGEALFSEGDISDRVLLLEQGLVKITHSSADGRETILGLRGAGEVLGELSSLDGTPRSATAVALGPVQALVVAGPSFVRALRSDADATFELLQVVVGRLRDADRKRIEFSTLDTLGRVASRLLELAERFGDDESEDGVKVDLPLSQEELAAWCGASREATVKALRTLRELGAVETGRRAVTIRDLAVLRRYTDK
jgi:CRP-like cAMP-binding protein